MNVVLIAVRFFLVLLFLTCLCGLILGLISPRRALWGQKRTRRRALGLYGSGLLTTWLIVAVIPDSFSDGERRAGDEVAQVLAQEPKEKPQAQGREVDAFDLDEDLVYCGMWADDVFEFLRPEDMIGQTTEENPEIEDSLIVRNLFQKSGVTFELEFRRSRYEAPYAVTRILLINP